MATENERSGVQKPKDFWKENVEISNRLIKLMENDFNERVHEHYSMYTSLIKKLEVKDMEISRLKAEIQELTVVLRVEREQIIKKDK